MTTTELVSFEDKIARWAKLHESDSPGTKERVLEYWMTEMLETVIERARAASSELPDKVDLLISLSGFSPETTIVAYELLRPSRVLIVHSGDAPASINTIHAHLSGPGRLAHSDIDKRTCSPSEALSIYKVIKEALQEVRRKGERPSVIIDITGGKKVMSATAALAAWQLDLPLCYIDSSYDPSIRKPRPGSEYLILLPNPTELFGFEELNTTRTIFDNGAFDSAAGRYADLAGRLVEPAEARFMHELSAMYRAWCDLNFEAMKTHATQVRHELRRSQFPLDGARVRQIEEQVEFVLELVPENRLDMLLCYYLLGRHYQEQSRHDFAALLYYRTVEGCLTQHLEMSYEGFSVDAPDYALLGVDEADFTERYNALSQQVYPSYRPSALPSKLAFMNSAFVLHLLENPLMKAIDVDSERGMRWLFGLAKLRNRSVLAHGYTTISSADSQELYRLARRTLQALWKIHAPQKDFERICKTLSFVKMSS